ncbi:sulfurtransferase [Granulosicoccus antarcticus]|uniref:Thiosulfate sulfurtransferase n=1 Tax=Granulosicoccus antarcticus IMCC3135 TaxID=1192854 RepID=A0A2Z2P3R9_9GAMM|nr:rhodanese-like domain-containing protein [Granulosicoccus antarcticus]ASJ74464.1 Thiosulfate sulfurtransferase [Granulosicoccus antarcticus IMCC3135]
MSLPLILDVADLATLLADIQTEGSTLTRSNLCLVDLRSAEAFAAGHIPGACHGDAALLSRAESPVGGLLPLPEQFNRFLADIGANLGDQIIAYDGGGETAAARLLWVMDAYGYEVGSWLNGGFNAWQSTDLPVSHSAEKPASGNLSLSVFGDNVMSADELLSELASPTLSILDVRSAAEYNGTDVRSAMGGHVPGAQHLEWTALLDAQGRLLEDDALQAKLAPMKLSTDNTVVVYCQTHQRSAVTYVALKHLGFTDVRALDGAWSNWGNRADTPKE